MDYIELCFVIEFNQQFSDILIANLAELGYESFVETETGFFAYIPYSSFDEEHLLDCINSLNTILHISFDKKIIPMQNWNKVWEKNFEPIDIIGKCYIRAPFHSPKDGYQFNILIEPNMSFGTGHHQTTQLMIKELLKLEIKNNSLLDMGTGTGVLSIIAYFKGANPILAIDIDERCCANAIKNAKLNNINSLNVEKGNAQILESNTYNIILANINRNILFEDLPIFFRSLKKGGQILLSGFFEADIPFLMERIQTCGFKLLNTEIDNSWAMLRLIK